MVEMELSAPELARRVGVTPEHIRKLVTGHCLPSDSTLEKLCTALELDRNAMSRRVLEDTMIFRFGDDAWTNWGLNPKWAPFYILVPLLSPEQWRFVRTCIVAVAEGRKTSGGVCTSNRGATRKDRLRRLMVSKNHREH
jgi:transcriptional regulator with XRE-family HTH domain